MTNTKHDKKTTEQDREYQATPDNVLYARLISSVSPKSELEHYAAKKIEALEADNAKLVNENEKLKSDIIDYRL